MLIAREIVHFTPVKRLQGGFDAIVVAICHAISGEVYDADGAGMQLHPAVISTAMLGRVMSNPFGLQVRCKYVALRNNAILPVVVLHLPLVLEPVQRNC